jgi:hypothetical protein
VTGALLDFISGQGGSYPVPAIGTGNDAVSSLAFQFISGTGNWLVVGLNAGGAVKGSKSQLRSNFIQEDWGIAISSEYAVKQIISSLSDQLGALPPPYGPNPVLLSDTTICLFPDPFGGGCLVSADQQVHLESLGIALDYGQITISGTLRQDTSALLPPVTATFHAFATLSVAPDQSLQVAVSQPSVQLQEWYAQLLNTLAGGAFTGAIADGIQKALQAGSGTALSGLISAATLEAITSLGGTASISLDVNVNSISIVPDAIITQGTLDVGGRTGPPVAAAVALPGSSALTMNLNALGSWSPAHHGTSFSWDFGDGSSQLQSVDFAPSHAWAAPGVYTVRLTVSDETGTAATTAIQVKPGILEILPPPAGSMASWTICAQQGDFPISFTVLASGYPAPGGAIRDPWRERLREPAWAGHFHGQRFDVHRSAAGREPPNVIGGLGVNAWYGDYHWAWGWLWLWDCATLHSWPPTVTGPFTAERLLLAAAANAEDPAFPGLGQDLALSHSLLVMLAEMVAGGSRIFPIETLLGTADATAQRQLLERVAEQGVANMRAVRAAADEQERLHQSPTEGLQLVDPAQAAGLLAPARQRAYAALAAQLRGQMAADQEAERQQ